MSDSSIRTVTLSRISSHDMFDIYTGDDGLVYVIRDADPSFCLLSKTVDEAVEKAKQALDSAPPATGKDDAP